MERSAKKQCIHGNEGTAGGTSGAPTSTEGDGTAASSRCDYEVFLSFRGPDTRAAFTDHVYTNLDSAGIRVFKDDEDLRIGEEFATELLQAIKQSKILIPIFSKNYASSVWCLKEVAQMIECKKTGGQKIMPIFYDVAPAEVRHQTGGYGDAFLSHEKNKRHDEKTIQEWKAALKEVSFLNGWDLHNEGENRREGAFTKQLTEELFRELKKAYLVVSDCLVNVDNHVDKIMGMIGAQIDGTRIVGIHGMGGTGKTTIAKIIYNRLLENFEGCCFLSNIREVSERKGIECLQNQLISDIIGKTDVRNIDDGIKIIKDRLSNKRVLLLLDDLYEKNHMDALAGKRDWFGKGSKLIITTRNKEAFDVIGVDDYYELMGMDRDRSLQLFSKHAFRRDSPLDEYIDKSNKAIDIAGGLPLALEVIGSLLSHTEKKKWDATLKMLESVPHAEVQSKLRISYDALDYWQQRMFLDIACLFIGYDKDILVIFWDEPNFFPEVAMEVLQNLSLIKINEDNTMWMHDQIRDLGREMVRQESKFKIQKQSRVWDHEQGFDLLRKYKGKKEIEALCLNFNHEGQYCFTYEGFESLSDLRFLEMDGWKEYFHAEERLCWHELPSSVLPTNENSNLLPQLRWLSWHVFPPPLNLTNFSMEDVIILDLSNSEITDDWKGWSHMKVIKNLKVLNLSGCYKLRRLPDSIENMKSLIELDISQTHIKELPDSIGKLKNLKRLKMRYCSISKIPDALWKIEKLEEIEIEAPTIYPDRLYVNIGDCIYNSQSLRILRLDNADVRALPKLPESLITLCLESLKMDTFPDLSNLTNLMELRLSYSDGESDGESHVIPTDLTLPPQLKSLYLHCPNLRRLARLPESLSFLELRECRSLCSMQDLWNLKNLSSLDICDAAIEEIQGLGCLENLRDLNLSSLEHAKILPGLSSLNNLISLRVASCGNLVEIQGELPESLEVLEVTYCTKIQKLPDLSSLNGLRMVKIYDCFRLNVEAISSLCSEKSVKFVEEENEAPMAIWVGQRQHKGRWKDEI